MNLVKKALFQKLEKQGLAQRMIPGFLKSLSNYLAVEPNPDLSQINQKLQHIGWEEVRLDYHTFQLATTWMEREGLIERKSFAIEQPDTGAHHRRIVKRSPMG